jgi:heavy metal sensor kinase
MGKLRPKHLRTRLTLWYVFVLALVLAFSWGLSASFLFFFLRGQLDHYIVQDVETVEGLLFSDSGGRLVVRENFHNHPESKQVVERLLEVRSIDGEVLYRNERLGSQSLGGVPFPGEGEGGYSIRSMRLADGLRVRMASRRHKVEGLDLVIRVAYSEERIWARVDELAIASLFATPFVLVLAGFAGYLAARRALAPLEDMASRAEQITSERLHERLQSAGTDDELGHLARVFNNLLARLEQSFEQLRRFTSDASHELRTPLTSMRSVGEVVLQKDGNREEYRDTIGSMLEEVNRLTALVDNLLTISRADGGRIQIYPSLFSGMDLAREAAALFEVLIEDKNQQITVEGDEAITVSGDRVLLRQALVNIIHNAVKYSPVGGTISVRTCHEPGGSICFEVADSGPGISSEHAAKIFDRFYRVEASRSRDPGGAGLGLSIAQWAVRVHGGDIQLITLPGMGCIFQVRLPRELNGHG